MSAYVLVTRHVEAALAEAATQSVGRDVVARNLISEAVRILKETRSTEEIAAELASQAENIDDEDQVFMRP